MRYLTQLVSEFAQEKFVLIAGPRQVGKTTVAQHWLDGFDGLYLNWDIPEHREQILSRAFLRKLSFNGLVLDELHKHQRWKSWLKGLYDAYGGTLQVVVTGSARLETFHRSGDSLFGRYELLRLHPFSIGERTHGTLAVPPENWLTLSGTAVAQEEWDRLVRRSGFPEPFTRDDARQQMRWRRARRTLLIREDLRDLTKVQMIALVEQLVLLLPGRVGAPLSVNALKQDLGVAHDTVTSWLEALERIYICFRLAPFQQRLQRSLKKERKLYLWDWTEIDEPGPRFENVVASHLLKAVHAWTDTGFGEFDLYYWRDREHREVDFVVTKGRKPVAMIEAKLTDSSLSPSLIYLGKHFPDVPVIQLVDQRGVDETRGNARIVDAARYLSSLP